MNNKEVRNEYTGLEIAVIGMAGRFPGSKYLKQYWDNLINGVESVSFFSDEELIESGCDPDMINRANYVKAKAILEDTEYFDSEFFGYTLKDAEVMDPQIRIFHECVWEALEDAGYNPISNNESIGICVGASSNINWENNIINSDDFDPSYFPLINKDFLSTLLSYKLNLRGPSMIVNTACSTSLVAIHQACRCLLTGECRMMLVGAVSILSPIKQGYLYEEGFVMSNDGHCRAFSEDANGTIGGSGAGVVMLKRLKDAQADNDNIYAIIKGSSVNNDGNRKVGYSAPSVDGQAICIRTALKMSKVQPETISYVEAHGTGTHLGDPTEIEALTKAFNTKKKSFCAIGSVKSNIGHLDTASGIASFIKSVLILKNRMIPPSLHFIGPNPNINFIESPFYVNTECSRIEESDWPVRVGVNSLGIGGTNAHIILEEYSNYTDSEVLEKTKENVILISARSEAVLERYTENILSYLKNNNSKNLDDIAYTLQIGRKSFKHRTKIVCRDINEAIYALSTADSEKIHTTFVDDINRQVVFMFSSSYMNLDLLLYLYENNSYFKEVVDECYCVIEKNNESPFNKKKDLKTIEGDDFEELLFIARYSIGKLLIYFGVEPSYVIGYGIGEYVAACIAGVLSIKDSLTLVSMKSKMNAGELNENIDYIKKMINNIQFNPPKIDFISSTLKRLISVEEVSGYEYWINSITTLETMEVDISKVLNIKNLIFVKIAPNNSARDVIKYYNEYANKNQLIEFLHFDSDIHSYEGFLINKLGQLWSMGKDIKWANFYLNNKKNRISLPTYSFEMQPHNSRVSRLKMVHQQESQKNSVNVMESYKPQGINYERLSLSSEYIPPKNSVEILIITILKEIIGVKSVGVLDNFFELGVDSIKAIRLASKLQKHGYKVSMDRILRLSNAKQLANEILQIKSQNINEIDKIGDEQNKVYKFKEIDNSVISKIMKEDKDIKEVYPLSPMQKAILAQNIVSYKKGNDVFILIFKLEGILDVSLFKKAWIELIKRHSVLRTKFLWKKLDEPLQVVYKELDINFKEYDWSELSYESQQFFKLEYISSEKEQGFKSTQVPLMRFCIAKCNNNLHKFIWSFQHSLFDGWSMHTLIKELMIIYKAFENNSEYKLEESKSFINYIEWLNNQDQDKAKEFWKKQFDGFSVTERLPEKLYKEVGSKFSIVTEELRLSKLETSYINEFVRKRNLTLNTLIQTAWGILMSNLTKCNDLIIGVETSGRSESIGDIETMVGLFIAVLPLRIRISEKDNCLKWMKELQSNQLEMRKYEYVTMQDVAKWNKIPVRLIQDAVYERTLVYQNFPMELKQKEFDGISICVEERVSQIDVPLRIYATPGDELALMIVYNDEQYSCEFTRKMLESLKIILEEICSNEEVTMGYIDKKLNER